MKRKVCVITGTRADYGILFPVMKAISQSRNLELYIVATSMHLMPDFGYTLKEIKRDKFKISDTINVSYSQDSAVAMADSTGRAIAGFAKIYTRLKPDFVVIMGDRWEMLAAAVTACYMNIAIAHIHGGEISGHVDGIVRHAITKFSHIHFPATFKARDRILKLGEEPWRIFVTGAPALDRILGEKLPSQEELIKKYRIDKFKSLLLLAQHPVATQEDAASRQIKITLQAIDKLKLSTIIIYPNADAGGRRMISQIQAYEGRSFIRTFKSLPHKDYLGLMKIASVLIGNSSSGIIEAPSLKLPVVNIGIRQQDRQRSSNVIDVAHNKKAILKAIKYALDNKLFIEKIKKCKNPYGDGNASVRITKVLSGIRLDNRLLLKKMTY